MSDQTRNHFKQKLGWHDVAGQVESILSEIAVGVVVQDNKGRVVYANKAAVRRLDATPSLDLRRRPLATSGSKYAIYDQDDLLVPDQKLPSRRVLRGESWAEAVLHFVPKNRKLEEFWLMVKAVPVRDDDAKTQFVITISYDLTLLKQAEIRLRQNNARLMGMLEDVMDAEDFDAEPRRRGAQAEE